MEERFTVFFIGLVLFGVMLAAIVTVEGYLAVWLWRTRPADKQVLTERPASTPLGLENVPASAPGHPLIAAVDRDADKEGADVRV
jgi:hypothetical protein